VRVELTALTDLWDVAQEYLVTRGWSIVSDEAKRQTEFWYDAPGFALLRWGAMLVRVDDDQWRLRVPERAGAPAPPPPPPRSRAGDGCGRRCGASAVGRR
jgi:hypothetical protein